MNRGSYSIIPMNASTPIEASNDPGRTEPQNNRLETTQRVPRGPLEQGQRLLPVEFAPGPYDVICARGGEAANHSGNKRYKDIIKSYLPQYSKAESKLDKSIIVSTIVDSVRAASRNGGFVRQNDAGQWIEVGDNAAREKTGQCIRDQLHSKYKSSTKAKKQRRKEIRDLKKGKGKGKVDNDSPSKHTLKKPPKEKQDPDRSSPTIYTSFEEMAEKIHFPEKAHRKELRDPIKEQEEEASGKECLTTLDEMAEKVHFPEDCDDDIVIL